MSIRRKLVAGNWKMNGGEASISLLLRQLMIGLSQWLSSDIVVFPSFVHLSLVRDLLKKSQVAYGAQTISQFDDGAYTGEISGSMLKELECDYVLIGHSERRQLFGEMDDVVTKKFQAALKYRLIPVLCVGETREERENHQTEAVVLRQLNAVIEAAGIEAFHQAIIAYEPIWAIGTGLTATPDQAQEVHALVRSHLAQFDKGVAEKTRILYGGSVKGSNAKELFSMPDVDGGLVGGASLKAEEFITICQS